MKQLGSDFRKAVVDLTTLIEDPQCDPVKENTAQTLSTIHDKLAEVVEKLSKYQ